MAENPSNKLTDAYNQMLARAKQGLEKAGKGLGHALEAAEQKASELGELSREEAGKVGDYLRRDLHDAGQFLAETGQDLKAWLRFDLEQVESRMAELFLTVADKTKLELDKLAERAAQVGVWHTGEVTGIGTLQCQQCGEELHFHKTGHIPPCPKCQGTKFSRISWNA